MRPSDRETLTRLLQAYEAQLDEIERHPRGYTSLGEQRQWAEEVCGALSRTLGVERGPSAFARNLTPAAAKAAGYGIGSAA